MVLRFCSPVLNIIVIVHHTINIPEIFHVNESISNHNRSHSNINDVAHQAIVWSHFLKKSVLWCHGNISYVPGCLITFICVAKMDVFHVFLENKLRLKIISETISARGKALNKTFAYYHQKRPINRKFLIAQVP